MANVSGIESLKKLALEEGLDGLIVFDLLNVRRLCGFTGSNGLLAVTPEDAGFFTDSRYTLQAGEQVSGCEIIETPDLEKRCVEWLGAADCGYVGLERAKMTSGRLARLDRLAKPVAILDLGNRVTDLRLRKSSDELATLKRAAALSEEALKLVLPLFKPGAKERDVALAYRMEVLKLGAEGLSFDTIIAGGPRGALPHAVPGDRQFVEGDLVVVDFGVFVDGYASDQTVTIPIGEVGELERKVYQIVYEAQARGLEALRSGVKLADVDGAARDHIKEAGYGDRFGHGTGHGVGLAVHEPPTVSPKSREVADAGMVVTVEPGIYLPGKFGVRLEDTVAVNDEGYERITSLPKEFGAVLTL